jgi:starch synthase (maltosyl-transferring)
MKNLPGRSRVIIENVSPQIDGGNFAVKRTLNESVAVEADIFADGHDAISTVVKFRHEKNSAWVEAQMKLVENDRWRGQFTVSELGNYFYTIEAWINRFESWRKDLKKKMDAGQEGAAE